MNVDIIGRPWIIHTQRKKLGKVNTNRLWAFNPYNDENFNTDPFVPLESADAEDDMEEVEPAEVAPWRGALDVGQLVLTPVVGDITEKFSVARLLQRRPDHPNGHLIQWFGNNRGKFPGPWHPCWLEPAKPHARSPLPTQYYRNRPSRREHLPYTNDTSSTKITDENFLPYVVALDSHQFLTRPVLEALAQDNSISWGQEDLAQMSSIRVHSQRARAEDFF